MLHINLSMPECSRFGRALMDFWYSTVNEEMTPLLLSVSGYPHNGGMHTLVIGAHPKDVAAWLDLFEEKYPYVKEELQLVRQEMTDKGHGRITLMNLAIKQQPFLTWQYHKGNESFIDPKTGIQYAAEYNKGERNHQSEWLAGTDPHWLGMSINYATEQELH